MNTKNQNKGFTLVEMLVIVAIMSFLSSTLILNFRASNRSQVALQRAASEIVSEIRRAQTLTVTTSTIQGGIPCGYGIHYESSTNSSFIYTYFNSKGGGDCSLVSSRNYLSGDLKIADIKFTNSNIELKNSFSDVFFEPPDPITFINNDPDLLLPPEDIEIGFKNGTCPTDCRTIQIFTSGRIDIL